MKAWLAWVALQFLAAVLILAGTAHATSPRQQYANNVCHDLNYMYGYTFKGLNASFDHCRFKNVKQQVTYIWVWYRVLHVATGKVDYRLAVTDVSTEIDAGPLKLTRAQERKRYTAVPRDTLLCRTCAKYIDTNLEIHAYAQEGVERLGLSLKNHAEFDRRYPINPDKEGKT